MNSPHLRSASLLAPPFFSQKTSPICSGDLRGESLQANAKRDQCVSGVVEHRRFVPDLVLRSNYGTRCIRAVFRVL